MGSGQAPVYAAVITASAAVLAVVLGQVFTAARERAARAQERQRSALVDAQDAALVVRSALRAAGEAITAATRDVAPSPHVVVRSRPDVDAARADADARLDVRLARVGSESVRNAVRAWQQQARFAFLGDEEVTERDEAVAWSVMNAKVARVLADDDVGLRRQLRRRERDGASG